MRIRLLAALAVVCIPRAASADSVTGTRSERLTERSHTIDLRVAPGHATLRVRRVLDNQGPRHDQAMVDIDLPAGAVATGLRTLGMVNGEHRWFEADLMEAEAAAAKYKELTGVGGYYPKDPALLSWRTASLLKLQVFPVAPKSLKTVEYTLEMPTEYEEGRDVVHLSPLGTEHLTADVVVSAADSRDKLLVGGKVVPAGTRLKFHGNDSLDIAIERHDPELLGGSLAQITLAASRVLQHTRIEAARRLSQIPKTPSVVVVLDASRSITGADADAQVAAAGAYLTHLPDAHVEVITFDRTAHRRYGRLVASSSAVRDLASSPIARKNGSAVDAALADAESVLLASPPGPRRVVLLTDLRTRKSLDPAKLRATFARSGAILHIGSLTDGAPAIGRDDDGDWATVARSTGGLLWSGTASNDPGLVDEMKSVFEEWVRPLRIDHLKVQTPGAGDAISFPGVLAEGEVFDVERIDPSPISAIVMSGELWSSKIHGSIRPDPLAAKRWSALVFGSSLLSDLSEKEMMTLAKMGHAVSPVTSLLAIEPGVRPSTEGLEEGGSGQGFGNGHGRLGGSHMTRSPRISNFDPVAFLRGELEQAWKSCGGAGKTATVEIETTRAEIVDVPLVTVEPAAPSAQSCLVEATWRIDLPSAFDAERTHFSISL